MYLVFACSLLYKGVGKSIREVGNVEPYASARRWVNFTQKVGKFYPDTHPALMSVSKSLF